MYVGTDCEDCGPVGYSNFTVVNDDKFWDDDDNYFDFNDAEFLGEYPLPHHTHVNRSSADDVLSPLKMMLSSVMMMLSSVT